MLLLVENMTKPLFHRCLLNPPSWHVCIRPRRIHQMLKWGNWLVGLVGLMLSSMLYQNIGLNWYIKAQNCSLDWCYHLLISRYCWMKPTTLSCLLIFGPKRCILCYLLVCGGHRWENPVREFVSTVRFVNVLNIAHKHPQAYLNLLPLLTEGLDLDLWTV